MLKTFINICVLTFLCSCQLKSAAVSGAVGAAGEQTPVQKDTPGNIFGYYEYLPVDFQAAHNTDLLSPLIFYWNGANAIIGNGRN